MNNLGNTKLKVIEKLMSPALINFVLGELAALQKLPSNGLLAGQGPASKIYEFLGLPINPVVNDIDIFIAFTSEFIERDTLSKYLKEKQSKMQNELGHYLEVYTSSDYQGLKIATGDKYTILGTTRFQKINKVFIKSPSYVTTYNRDSLAYDIIDSFDLNCTQVGIDLATKKIYFTENFVDFLYSKQLEIVNYNTPIHSLIRLARKNRELGAYANLEEEQMLTGIMSGGYLDLANTYNFFTTMYEFESTGTREDYNLKYRDINLNNWISENTYSLSRAALFFGKKHLEHYEQFKDDLDLFSLAHRVSAGESTESFEVEWINDVEKGILSTLVSKDRDKTRKIFFDTLHSTNVHKHGSDNIMYKELYTDIELLVNDFRERENRAYTADRYQRNFLRDSHSNQAFPMFYVLPKMIKSFKKTRKQTVHFINDNFSKFEKNERDNSNISELVGHSLKCNLMHIDTFNSMKLDLMKSFSKKMQKHPELQYIYNNSVSLNDIQKINSTLSILEKEFGEMIYGLVERIRPEKAHFTLDILKPKVEALINNRSKILKDRNVEYKGELGEVKELVTGMELYNEGQEMSHCVGGYASSVKSGQCMIFAIKNKLGKRMTLEIAPHYENNDNGNTFQDDYRESDVILNYRMIQLQGKRNTPCTFEESVDLLKIINKFYELKDLNKENNVFREEEHRRNLNHNQNNNNGVIPEIDIDNDDIPF